LHNLYLQRYAWPGPLLADEPNNNTGIIVVIPCFNEPHILASLNSLFECETPNCKVEIIVVVNHAENEADHIKIFNQDTCDKIQEWIINHKKKVFFVLFAQSIRSSKKARRSWSGKKNWYG